MLCIYRYCVSLFFRCNCIVFTVYVFCYLSRDPNKANKEPQIAVIPAQSVKSTARAGVERQLQSPGINGATAIFFFFFFDVNTRVHFTVWRGPAKLGELCVQTCGKEINDNKGKTGKP